MAGHEQSATRGERLFRILLFLYPRSFRERFAEDLVRHFRRDRASRRFDGLSGAIGLWAYTLSDLLRTAFSERRNPSSARKSKRRRMRFHWFRDARIDLRLAARSVVKQPFFALTAALILAVGIGASSTIFSLANAFLIRPLPVRDGASLVMLSGARGDGQ